MGFKFFIGIDVSKSTLDVAVLNAGSPDSIDHCQVANNDTGITSMLEWLQEHEDFTIKNSLFCLEHTGMYNYPLLQLE